MRTLVTVAASIAGLVLVTPIFLLCLPFWGVAALTRFAGRLFEPRTISGEELIEFSPLTGWKTKPNLDAYCAFGAGVFHTKTDAEGWPGDTTLTESQVVAFGDSYVFGYGVDARAAFSGTQSKIRIKAIGVDGYNMVQELIWMKELSAKLPNKLVVWFICFSNDLLDNLLPNLYHYRQPFVARPNGSGDWQIIDGHLNRDPWPYSEEHNFRQQDKWHGAFGDNGLSRRVYSACEFLLRTGRDVCAEAGAQLVVLTIPWTVQLVQSDWERSVARLNTSEPLDANVPDRQFREICHSLGIPLVVGREFLDLSHYIPVEGHWNERGHKRVAEMLESLHQQHCEGKLLGVNPQLFPGACTLIDTGVAGNNGSAAPRSAQAPGRNSNHPA